MEISTSDLLADDICFNAHVDTYLNTLQEQCFMSICFRNGSLIIVNYLLLKACIRENIEMYDNIQM